MAVNVGTIEGLLVLRDEFTGVLGNAAQALEETGKKAVEVGKKMEAVGTQLTVGLTVPLVAIGGTALHSFGQFDDALNSSIAIMGDVSEVMRRDMAAAAVEVSEGVRASATQAAESFFFLASAGLDAAASIAALPAVAAFGQAGMFDMATATDLLTDAQSALGLTIRDDAVANMLNMVRVSDVLVKANTLANASVEQFSQALTTKAATAMRELGIEVESGVAVLAAWADQGVKAGLAGERFNIVTRDLQTAYRNNTEEFRKWNIEVFDAAGNFRSMADIISDMEQALGPMSAEQRGATLALLGFTDRSIVATKSLIGLSDNIRQYETQLREAAGTTQEVSDKQMQSFVAQLGLLKDRIVNVGISLGEALMPAVTSFMSVANVVVDVVKDWVEVFGNLPESVRVVVTTLLALAAAAGPVLLIAGKLTVAYGTLLTTFPAVAGAITAVITVLTGPAGLAVATGALLLSLKPVRDFLINLASNVFMAVKSGVETVIAQLRLWWKATEDGRKFLVAFGKVVAKDLVKVLGVAVDWIVKVAKEVGLAVVAFVKWTKVIPVMKATLDANVKSMKIFWQWVVKTSTKVLEWVNALGGLESIFAVINPAMALSVRQLKDWAEEARESAAAAEENAEFTAAMDQAMADMAATMPQVTDEIEDNTVAVVDSTTANRLWGSSTDDMIIIANQVDNAFSGLGDAADNMADQVRNSREGYDLLKRTFDTWQLSAMDVVQLIRDLGQAHTDGVITADQLADAMARLDGRFDETRDGVSDITNLMFDLGEGLKQLILDGNSFESVLRNMSSAVSGFSVGGFLDDFTGAFADAMESGNGVKESLKGAFSEAGGLAGVLGSVSAALSSSAEQADRMAGAAIGAVAALAQGNYIGAILQFGTLLSEMFGDSSRSVQELRDGITGMVGDIVAGSEVVRNFGQVVADFAELIAKDTGEASEELGESFGSLIDVVLGRIEDLTDFSAQAMLEVAGGVGAISKLVTDAGNVSFPLADNLRKAMDALFDVMAERNAFIVEQSTAMLDGLAVAFGDFSQVAVDEVGFAQESLLQAFNAMVSAGVPLSEIVAELGEDFVALGNRGTELGLELSAEFARVGEVFGILADKHLQNVITKFGGITDATRAAGNMGLLSATQFDFFGDRARNTFNQLIEGGLTSAEAIAQMGPELQLLQDLQEQYGFEVDANTQLILDQAIAQGVVAEKGLTANEIMIAGFDRMIVALNRLIVAMGGVPVAFEGWSVAATNTAAEVRQPIEGLRDDIRGLGRDIDNLPDIDIDVPNINPPTGGGGGNPGGGFASGTGGFVDFGTETPTTLHGTEQVITAREGGDIASMVVSAVQTAAQAPTGLAEILEGGFAAMVDGQMQTVAAQGEMVVTLGELTGRIAEIEARGNTR